MVKVNDSYQEAFVNLGKQVYPVANSTPSDAAAEMQLFLDLEEGEQPYDLVFVDLPGTINTPGVLQTISRLDHIFIPLIADQLVIKSSLEFGLLVNEDLISQPDIHLKSLHFFWNHVVKSEKSPLYDVTERVIKNAGMDILDTHLYHSVKFRKSDFRSTIFPMHPTLLKDSNMVSLIEEILGVIGVPFKQTV
jgi:cellulose biosynthesis protein BcsQ